MSSTERIEPAYVVDTVALIRYLMQHKKLGNRAKDVFEAAIRGETALIIPAIVVAELYYADKKRGLFDDFAETYDELKAQPYTHFVDLTADDVLDFATNEKIPEMHDRMIVSLAQRLGVPILTSDHEIVNAGTDVVW